VGLFALNDAARAWLVGAVAAAAHDLGVFALLARGPLDVAAIAGALSLPPRRLRPLLDVLAASGALTVTTSESAVAARTVASESAVAARTVTSESAAAARTVASESGVAARAFAVGAVPPPATLPREGWGLLADVIRRDRPLPDDQALPAFHAHLRDVGAAPARALAASLAELPTAARGLLDLGGGAGAYSEAFAAQMPPAPVTLVDRASVIELARPHLGGRVRLVAGDILDDATPLGDGHGLALLANVLHLYGAADCARLVARAAAAVAPAGFVVVKDLFVAADRAAPMESLLFAVNMALYTDAGDVHDAGAIAAWLAAAGLHDIAVDVADGELVARAQRV
jgi:hypothetical protein